MKGDRVNVGECLGSQHDDALAAPIHAMRRATLAIWGVLALCVLSPGFLWAAIQGAVRGTVVDGRDGRPVDGASVRLVGRASALVRTATTDARGRYVFPNVELGEYTLTAEGTGLEARPVAVVVRSADTVVQDLALMAAAGAAPAPQVLPPITVTAARPEVPASSATQVVVSQPDLQRTPGAELNIKEALKSAVPGAIEASEHLHFHGGHEVGFLVNGVPIPDNSVFGQFFSLLDPKIVKNLEVITGGFPAEYGNRTSGIVNIVTKAGEDLPNHLEVGATAGTSDIRSATVQGGGAAGRFSGVLLANLAHTDRFINAPTFRDIHDRGDTLLLFGNGSVILTPRDTLRVLGLAGGANVQIPNTPEEQDLGIDNRERERNSFQTLSWDHTFSDELALTTSAYHHGLAVRLLENEASTPFIPNERRHVDYYGGKSDLTFRGLRSHTLKGGLDVYGVQVSELFTVVPNPSDPDFTPFTDGPRTSRGYQVSAYLQDQWALTEVLTLNVGLRYDRFEGFVTDKQLSPRVGLTYRIVPTGTRLFASVDRLFNPPPLEGIKIANSVFAETLAQTAVRAERDTYTQAGVEQRFPWGTTRLVGWYRQEKRFLDHEEVGNTTVFVPVNVANGKSYGADVLFETVNWRGWAARGFYALGYSLGRGGVTGGVFNRVPEERSGSFFLDHDQRHTAVGQLRYEDLAHDWWATFATKYGSGFTDGDGPKHLPGTVTFDLAGEKTLRSTSWGRVALRVQLINLFDQRFFVATQSEFVGTHTNIPRTFLVTLRGEF